MNAREAAIYLALEQIEWAQAQRMTASDVMRALGYSWTKPWEPEWSLVADAMVAKWRQMPIRLLLDGIQEREPAPRPNRRSPFYPSVRSAA